MTKVLKTFCGIAAVVTGLAGPAAAQDDSGLPGTFTGNIALTNDYVFRGYTQTTEDIALQGGFDWDSGVGFYLGTWGSNINFDIPGEGSLELDVYGGYRGTIGKFSYDVGFIGYLYPGTAKALNYEFWEGKIGVGYDFGVAAVSAALNYSPDYFGGTDDSYYWSGKVLVPLAEGLSIDGTIARSDLKLAGADYTDWSVGATYAFPWFTTDVRYYDTDVRGCRNVCDARFVMKFSRSF